MRPFPCPPLGRLVTAALLACGLPLAGARAGEVTVFAAASLKTALDEVAEGFTTETGHGVTISYGGSNMLAQQIIAGAPADIFLSAAENWMDEVEKAGLVEERRDLLGNRLVLVTQDTAARDTAATKRHAPVELEPGVDLAALLGTERLAMALVDAVPAGQYGKAALKHLGLWDAVAPAVVQSDNVRASLALVATGEAGFGIVYASDTVAEPKVRLIATFPEESHPPIRYPAALLKGHSGDAATAFMAALGREAAGAVFTRNGFTLLPAATP